MIEDLKTKSQSLKDEMEKFYNLIKSNGFMPKSKWSSNFKKIKGLIDECVKINMDNGKSKDDFRDWDTGCLNVIDLNKFLQAVVGGYLKLDKRTTPGQPAKDFCALMHPKINILNGRCGVNPATPTEQRYDAYVKLVQSDEIKRENGRDFPKDWMPEASALNNFWSTYLNSSLMNQCEAIFSENQYAFLLAMKAHRS